MHNGRAERLGYIRHGSYQHLHHSLAATRPATAPPTLVIVQPLRRPAGLKLQSPTAASAAALAAAKVQRVLAAGKALEARQGWRAAGVGLSPQRTRQASTVQCTFAQHEHCMQRYATALPPHLLALRPGCGQCLDGRRHAARVGTHVAAALVLRGRRRRLAKVAQHCGTAAACAQAILHHLRWVVERWQWRVAWWRVGPGYAVLYRAAENGCWVHVCAAETLAVLVS